jgi:hypothetical protein
MNTPLPRSRPVAFDSNFKASLNDAVTIKIEHADLDALARYLTDMAQAAPSIQKLADQGHHLSGADGGSSPLGSHTMPDADALYTRMRDYHDGFVRGLNAQVAHLKRAAGTATNIAKEYAMESQRDMVGVQQVNESLGVLASQQAKPRAKKP